MSIRALDNCYLIENESHLCSHFNNSFWKSVCSNELLKTEKVINISIYICPLQYLNIILALSHCPVLTEHLLNCPFISEKKYSAWEAANFWQKKKKTFSITLCFPQPATAQREQCWLLHDRSWWSNHSFATGDIMIISPSMFHTGGAIILHSCWTCLGFSTDMIPSFMRIAVEPPHSVEICRVEGRLYADSPRISLQFEF